MTVRAWVGEHGPESLALPADTQVIPLPEPSDPEKPEDRP